MKYMLTLKMTTDKEFPYLLDLLPCVYESNGFMHPLNAYKPCEDLNEGPNGDPNKTLNGTPNDRLDDGGYLLKEKLLNILNLTLSERMEALIVKSYKTVNKVVESILAIL